jgi:hypothetical protein
VHFYKIPVAGIVKKIAATAISSGIDLSITLKSSLLPLPRSS